MIKRNQDTVSHTEKLVLETLEKTNIGNLLMQLYVLRDQFILDYENTNNESELQIAAALEFATGMVKNSLEILQIVDKDNDDENFQKKIKYLLDIIEGLQLLEEERRVYDYVHL